jgi:hypothetical protein
MRRTFSSLACLDALALVITFLAGLVHGFAPERIDPLLHFGLGLFTIIFNLAVHCIVFIYFLGTGRMIKEIALAYSIPDEPLPRLTRDLKRQAFPPALLAMLLPIAAAAAGQGTALMAWPWQLHLALALASLAANGWAFVVEYRTISKNAGVLHEVMGEVDRIRAAQGLPSNAEQLRQEGW